jgi:addiction module HigA family antidote
MYTYPTQGEIMSKSLPSPGFILKKLMDEYQTNPNRLSKEIGLTQTAVRLITIDKAKISVPVALRFAKYFGTTPEYWISLQNKYDLAEASKDKSLDKILKGIKKAEAVKKAAPEKKAAPAKKTAAKAAASKKPAAKAAASKPAAAKPKASPAPKKSSRPSKEAKPAAAGESKKRGRKPKDKPAPAQEKPFVPDVVLIKKQDTAPVNSDVSDPVSSEE